MLADVRHRPLRVATGESVLLGCFHTLDDIAAVNKRQRWLSGSAEARLGLRFSLLLVAAGVSFGLPDRITRIAL